MRVGLWEIWRQKGRERREGEGGKGDGEGGKVFVVICTGILLDDIGKGLFCI